MLNDDKIKLMTKLSLYEHREGKKAFASGKYYRSDYISLGLVNSAIIGTLAFILILVCVAFVNLETLLTAITSIDIVMTGRVIIVIYLVYMIVYLSITYIIYRIKYDSFKEELKEYDNDLKALYTIYKDEENTLSETGEIKKGDLDIAIMEEK